MTFESLLGVLSTPSDFELTVYENQNGPLLVATTIHETWGGCARDAYIPSWFLGMSVGSVRLVGREDDTPYLAVELLANH